MWLSLCRNPDESPLEAVQHAHADIVVVLAAAIGIDVVGRLTGIKIARFTAEPPAIPEPHVKSGSELHHTRVRAARTGIRPVKFIAMGITKAPVASPDADPWADA